MARRSFLWLLAATSFSAEAGASPPADSIEYALANTHVRVGIEMVLEACPTAIQRIPRVRPTITITPVPVAGRRYRISGNDLRSFLQRREVALGLYDNGTIKSIGAAASDRTGAILGNIIRIGTAAAGLGIGMPGFNAIAIDPSVPRIPACNAASSAAVAERQRLRQRVSQLRQELQNTTEPVRLSELRAAVTAIAGHIVDLETNELRISLTRTIEPPEPGNATSVELGDSDLSKWFVNMDAGFLSAFHLPLQFARAPEGSGDFADAPMPRAPFIALREPAPAVVSIQQPANSVWRGSTISGSTRVPMLIGQWGGISYYPLRAGLFRGRSLKVELDQFGRRTSIDLNSEAGGEAVTAAIAGVGDSLLAYHNATSEMRQQQLRTQELEVEQKYNRLLRCQAIIEAGGYECP